MRAPDLHCPIESRMSPHAGAAHRWLLSWLHRCGVPMDRETVRHMETAGFARYAARLYPGADVADLNVLTGMITWFFLLDDACDAVRDPQPARLRPYLAGVIDCLQNPRASVGAFAGPMRTMLRDLWRVLRDRMPGLWLDRFTMHTQEHIDGILIEAANKAARRRPGLAEYMRIRRATSASYVGQTMAEFGARAVVPDPIYHHPAVRAYSEAANDLLAWFNDLISLDHDRDTAGGHNLVLALAGERRLTLARAIDEAVAMWHRTMDDLVALRARMPSFGPAMDAALARHLDAMANSVRATLDWSAESGRYPSGRTLSLSLGPPCGSGPQA